MTSIQKKVYSIKSGKVSEQVEATRLEVVQDGRTFLYDKDELIAVAPKRAIITLFASWEEEIKE